MLLWIDPRAATFAILLTTLPREPRGLELAQVSNQVAASWTCGDAFFKTFSRR